MPDITPHSIARLLLDIGAIGFTPNQPTTFKSGIRSPMYIDNRSLPYHPHAWRQVITAFVAEIERLQLEFDALAGIAVGGIPHSAALGYRLYKPSVFIRKEAKEHGKQQRIEGGDVNSKRVILVEDLVTTGGSSLSGVAALRDAGALVNDCMVIASYGFAEATESFAKAQLNLHPLTQFDAVYEVLVADGRLSQRDLDILAAWHRDPHGWSG